MKKILFIVVTGSFIACNNGPKKPPPPDPNAPKIMAYSIIHTYPHDTSSYTQGLLIYKGNMYEGTGNYGFSKLKQVDLQTGNTIRDIALDKKYFGEGVTILNDTVYQLTWKEKTVFAYTLKDFKKVKEFTVDIEGWGMTNDGKNIIVSTGGSDLHYYDPSTFKLLKTQTVTESSGPSFNLNELEFINGFIYCNQYEYPYILKIEPESGRVVAKADVTAIWDKVKTINPKVDVPNGIAYDTASQKMYITGKWWPELYEVQFSQ